MFNTVTFWGVTMFIILSFVQHAFVLSHVTLGVHNATWFRRVDTTRCQCVITLWVGTARNISALLRAYAVPVLPSDCWDFAVVVDNVQCHELLTCYVVRRCKSCYCYHYFLPSLAVKDWPGQLPVVSLVMFGGLNHSLVPFAVKFYCQLCYELEA